MLNLSVLLKQYILLFFFTFLGVFPTVFAAPKPDTVVVAGKQYDRNFFHRLLWGKHYRKVWAEPVRVPFLDLTTEAGGLKPTERGGSYQTKNLRLLDPDGRQYVIRSVDKDASQTLSPEKRKSIIGKVIRDQTSVIHPYGAMIVSTLAGAAGIYHASPRYFVVADQKALGEFREEFANMLVMLEQRPEGNWETREAFGNSKEIVSSKKAFTQFVKSPENVVDARLFLRSRLFDMLLGDWSRREDQWRWATYELPGKRTLYKPIPRDRDHAFFKFNDGLIPGLASLKARHLQTFGPKIKNLKGLNKTGEPLDRSLLVFLKKEDFRQIGDSLKMQLTDEVIENALRQWPENIYKMSAKEFSKNLKNRRDQLPEVAEKFYRILAKDVEMRGTDESEIFRIIGKKNSLLVEMLKPGKKGQPDTLLFSRTFYPNETKSLKIFGLGEEDTFEFLGEGSPLKKLEIYDGEDEDEIIYNAKKNKRIDILDSGDGNKIPETKKLKVKLYKPKANEFDGKGWLLRHRLH